MATLGAPRSDDFNHQRTTFTDQTGNDSVRGEPMYQSTLTGQTFLFAAIAAVGACDREETAATHETGESALRERGDRSLRLRPIDGQLRTLTLAECATANGQPEPDATARITSIYSDEPENARGRADGDTLDDIVITDAVGFQVRAEQRRGGNGRVYGVRFVSTDGEGNEAEGLCRVGVESGRRAPVDDGPGAGYIVRVGDAPECMRVGENLARCLVRECPEARHLRDGFAFRFRSQCNLELRGGVYLPTFTDAAEAGEIGQSRCDDERVQSILQGWTHQESGYAQPFHLSAFCQGGDLLPPHACEAACARDAECFGAGDPDIREGCLANCAGNSQNTSTLACWSAAASCDEVMACRPANLDSDTVLGDYSADSCADSVMFPSSGEDGHWMALHVLPPSYPYLVTGARYTTLELLMSELDLRCTTEVTQHIQVFVQRDAWPAAEPLHVADVEVPGETLADRTMRTVEVTLPAPILLQEGDHLFVSVSLNGARPDVSCVVACYANNSAAPDSFWWSNAVAPPFDWWPLEWFWMTGHHAIFAIGEPVP